MPLVERSQVSSASAPALDLFTTLNGVPTDVVSLEFAIFEKISTPGVGTQVYPTSGRVTVDTDLTPDGDKISTGHYAASWTVPADAALGIWEIRWYYTVVAGLPEQTFAEEFVVVSVAAGSPAAGGYCTVQNVRDEGITEALASTTRVTNLIELASRYIDRMTGRYFEPRAKTLDLDGSGTDTLLLGEPIVAITELYITTSGWVVTDTAVAAADYTVYNRHLSQSLLDPDDRDCPKIVLISDLTTRSGRLATSVFTKGVQNIRVVGTFGYTEADGTSNGRVPLAIRHAATLLVTRMVPKAAKAETRSMTQAMSLVSRIKTRHQSISFARIASGYGLTGDPEIDNILKSHQRPIRVGAA